MANVLFISEQYIKDTSYVDENVDVKLIRSNIQETQDFRILPILGTALYEDIKTKISAGNTATVATLLNTYIAPALKYWVLHDAAYLFQFKIMNKAVVKRSSENAEPIDIRELDRLMDYFKDRAEYYSERITKYLLENNTTYPLYDNFGDGIDAVSPRKQNYTQGIYLGNMGMKFDGVNSVDKGRQNYCE